MYFKKKHECQLPSENETISYFIPNSQKYKQRFRKACIISSNISHRRLYLKSYSQIEQERALHLATHYYIIHPFSAFRYYWELIMIIVFINKLLIFPYVVIQDTKYLFLSIHYILILQLMSIANIIIELSSGYFDQTIKEVVLQPKKIVKKYIFKLFLPELLATLPASYISYMFGYSELTYRSLLLLNGFNVISLLDYTEKIRLKREYGLFEYKCVQYLFILLFGVLWITSCLAVAVCYDQNLEFDQLQWIKYAYGTIELVYNLGQRDITVYGFELLVCVVAIFFGFIMWTLIIIKISLVIKSFFSSHRYYGQLLHEVLINNHFKFLTKLSRNRLLEYYNFILRNAYYNEYEIWRHMSEKIKNEVENNLFKSWYESEIFSECPTEVILSFLIYVQKDIYLSGDEVCKIGDICAHIYFIKTGTIIFYNSNQQKVLILPEGNFFAEDAIMQENNGNNIYTVVAIEPCEIYKLHRHDFYRTILKYPEAHSAVQRVLWKRQSLNVNNPLS